MDTGEVVFESRKFRVVRRQVRVADGALHAYDIVTHPGAAVVLPVLPDGRILLIHNYRVAVGGELLELPAGTLDPPEEPIACAQRELAEETGYQAGRLDPLVCFYSTPGICDECLHAFVATDLRPGRARREPGEQIRLAPQPLATALEMIAGGQIRDAKTIVTLLYYDRFGRRQGPV